MSIGAAGHALDDHAYDSDRAKDRFPKHTFGKNDEDTRAMQDTANALTYQTEPYWGNRKKTVLHFDGEVGGVPARVPVRLDEDGVRWQVRTMHPVGKDFGKGGEYDGFPIA
jgi:hypothetical protein